MIQSNEIFFEGNTLIHVPIEDLPIYELAQRPLIMMHGINVLILVEQ